MSKAKEAPKPSSNIPRWVWIFTPTVALVFLGFIVFLATVPTQTAIPKPEVESRDFGFYGQLKEKESKAPTPPTIKKSNKPSPTYILQAGSFRSSQDADRMRAQLLLSGLTAYVETVNVKDNPWHRVMVGPFNNRSRLNSAQDKLASANIEAIVKRVKK